MEQYPVHSASDNRLSGMEETLDDSKLRLRAAFYYYYYYYYYY